MQLIKQDLNHDVPNQNPISLLSPPPSLFPPLNPPPLLPYPCEPLKPRGAAVWNCANSSKQNKRGSFWDAPAVLPPNRPPPTTFSLPPSSPLFSPSIPTAQLPAPSLPYPPPGFPVPGLFSAVFLVSVEVQVFYIYFTGHRWCDII